MATFKNKREARCKTCGQPVPVGQGWTEGPPWVTTCAPCSGRREDAAPTICVRLDPTKGVAFSVKGDERLGFENFGKYRTAIEGAKWDGVRTNHASLDQALKILPRLAETGFVIDVTPDVMAAVSAKAEQLTTSVATAHLRIEKIDEALKARGLGLYEFQKQGIAWLASREAALLADDMGLGKTVQLLIALGEDVPVIVVGPAVAKGVWQREAAKWRPDLRVTACKGKSEFRYPERGEMVIVTAGSLTAPFEDVEGPIQPGCESLAKPLPGTVLIVDEAHMMKNRNSKRGAAFRTMCGFVREGHGKIWLATATPIEGRPMEIWSLFAAVGIAHEAFGTFTNFLRLFNGWKDDWGGYHWGTPEPEAAERIRRVSLRRIKTDVLDQLPPKTYREIKVDIDKAAKKRFAKAEEILANYTRFSRILDDETPTDQLKQFREEEQAVLLGMFGDAAADIEAGTRLASIAGRPDFEALANARAALAAAKIPAMMEIIEDFEAQEEPLVVFSDHRAPIDFLAKREGWAVITGDVSPEERARIQDDFQAGKLKGVAGTIRAMGVALTLTRASNALFVDLNWTPALNAQAEDRVFRIGQSRGVLITTLVADHPLDKRLFEVLAAKRHIITHSVEASRVQANLPAPEIQAVDFDAIARAAEEERRRDEEVERLAEERRKEFAGRKEEIEQKNAEEEKKDRDGRRRQRRMERWLREANTDPAPRTVAATTRQHWIVEKLELLAQLDPDRAAVRNDVGFSASDGGIGHKLAYLAPLLGLTTAEWSLAANLCHKYRRQVGEFQGAA